MPLTAPPHKREEETPPTVEDLFFQQTAKKGQGFWGVMRRVRKRVANASMPESVKRFGRGIWYGNPDWNRAKKGKSSERSRWLWEQRRQREYGKPYAWQWDKYGSRRKPKSD